ASRRPPAPEVGRGGVRDRRAPQGHRAGAEPRNQAAHPDREGVHAGYAAHHPGRGHDRHGSAHEAPRDGSLPCRDAQRAHHPAHHAGAERSRRALRADHDPQQGAHDGRRYVAGAAPAFASHVPREPVLCGCDRAAHRAPAVTRPLRAARRRPLGRDGGARGRGLPSGVARRRLARGADPAVRGARPAARGNLREPDEGVAMNGSAAIFYRDYRQRMTNVGFVFWDLLAPLAYLLLFGIGFERMMGSEPVLEGQSFGYTAFLVPGVLAMVTFSVAMNTSWGFFM